MHIVKLPHSGEFIKIPPVTFEHSFNIARLIYDNNNEGLINYIEDILNIRGLNSVDKLFVILKAREFFLGDELSVSSSRSQIIIPVYRLVEALTSVDDYSKVIIVDGIRIVVDTPMDIMITNSIVSDIQTIIKTIEVEGEKICFSKLDKESQDRIVSALPSSVFKEIKKYLINESKHVVLFEGTQTMKEKIALNLFTSDIFNFIKLLFYEYNIDACREIIFHLSKRLSADVLFRSTLIDIKFYLRELTNENKVADTSNSIPL
jgi:hypothetical protein